MHSREPAFRTARVAVRPTFLSSTQKSRQKKSPFHKNRLIYYERFSPRGTQTHSSFVVARTGFLQGHRDENLP